MSRSGFFLLLMGCLSVPPLAIILKDFNPPVVGDPAKSLVDNLMAQPRQKIGVPVIIQMQQLTDYARARDEAIARLREPMGARVGAWCDMDYAARFSREAGGYFSRKVTVIAEVLEKHGEGQARRIEAHWMNSSAKSAEALIRDAMTHKAIALNDLGPKSRIEGRRLALGVQVRPKACAA
jgi:L-fucose isomerase-like protein